MIVTLPSGHTATFRDVFQRGDRRDAQRAIVIVISPDGSRRMEGSVKTEIAGRIIRRMLVSWDFDGQPVPSQAATAELGDLMLDALNDEDAEALEAAVEPWVERVLKTDAATPGFVHTATGIRVTVVRPEDAAKLASLEGWAAEDGADPKLALPASGTSS